MLIHLYNIIMSAPLKASKIYTFIIIIASPPSKYSIVSTLMSSVQRKHGGEEEVIG
jgi:hypothetical protein